MSSTSTEISNKLPAAGRDDIFGLISCVTFAQFEKIGPVKILCIYTLKLQTFLHSKFSRIPLKRHTARLKFYLPSHARGSFPGRCALLSYENTEAWGNRCSPSLRKHQASSFVWTRITFQQLPLLNVTACLHTKAPLWLATLSLSRDLMTTGGWDVRPCCAAQGAGCCGGRLSAADVMKHDYVFGWRSGKGGAFPSGCNNH